MTAVGGLECGSSSSRGFLEDVPDDVLALVSAMISPQDVMRLSATCRKLRDACSADKLWLPHCERINCGIDCYSWRKGMDSYRALYRFMISVRSLVGLWVHQNPELGNLVYVTWGFVSVVGVRIIPQEVGPRGLDTGLLWSPVFEILGHPDGSLALFLHGRENNKDLCYPGRFGQSSSEPNVLLLEAEPLLPPNSPLSAETSEDSAGEECTKQVSGNKKKSKTPSERITFQHLGFGDRRRVLENLAPHIALEVPGLVASGALFPRGNGKKQKQLDLYQKDLAMLAERRVRLLSMYGFAKLTSQMQDPELIIHRPSCEGVPSDYLLKHLGKPADEEDTQPEDVPRAEFRSASFEGDGTSLADNGLSGTGSLAQLKRLRLQEFLKQNKKVGLLLHATSLKLDYYWAWPIMFHKKLLALYKLPEQRPVEGRDYAGLWGGTLGWPPGKSNEDKSGRALFFLLLSYDESDEGRLLIATKILEGTHHASYPNGSIMFTAKVDEFSSEPFPWETGRDGLRVDILNKFHGEGIASGYGFRYPGSKPGALFVQGDGVLSFVWRESKAVLSIERLDLKGLLEIGERGPALPHIANFAYLTPSYSNVFATSCD
ncbi:hypothetical protein R1flu_012652 [Riccia fluitans]|uniref:F-box domain-containing protein n=1 Tax=Riccia fluitans TaxID=41844 RepID=A0ABD1ZC91_9MARC